MERNIQRKGLVNWLLLLVLGAGAAAVAIYAHSATGLVSAVYMGAGFLIALVSHLQMRLECREQLEQFEFDELKKTASSSALFAGQDRDAFPAQRAREQFERYFVPAFTTVLFAVEGAAVYWLWRHAGGDVPATQQQGTVAMALYGLSAFVLYQFGKYAAVLVRLEENRLLRPQASHLLMGSLVCLVSALVEVAGWAGYPMVDKFVARALVLLLGVVAVENLLALVFEAYRPRLKGQAARPLYESRLIGLLGQPGGIITTVAQALDYQFGFKVSETWFYRFLEGAVAWLVLLQLGLLLASTMVVVVEPGEQALLERFGRPVQGRDVLGPGPHLKLPWPIERAYRYKTDRVQDFTLGIVEGEEHEHQRTLIWAKTHAQEEVNLLVASSLGESASTPGGEQTVPVNLLAVNIPIHYQVSNLRHFAYKHVNAGQLLERLSFGVLTRYLVNVDFNDIMSAGRKRAAEELRKRIQARADALELGVRVLFVGLHGIHPPVKVAPSFENWVGAIQDKEATNQYARAYEAQRVPLARAEAHSQTNQAAAYQFRVAEAALATARRFTNQLVAFHASPEVYQLRTRLDVLSHGMSTARTYVLATTNLYGVVSLNLEERIREDLLRVPLPKEIKQPKQ